MGINVDDEFTHTKNHRWDHDLAALYLSLEDPSMYSMNKPLFDFIGKLSSAIYSISLSALGL